MDFIPEKMITTSTYERLSIKCICGEELNVDYDKKDKLTDRTWCTKCNRYYERRGNHYIITGYRCFECQTQHKKLFTGFDKWNETRYICENCLEKKINNAKNTIDTFKKKLRVLEKRIEYKPDVIE